MNTLCNTYWGSHGCTDKPGHDGTVHTCGTTDYPCSQYDSKTGATRYVEFEDDDEGDESVRWSAWMKDGKAIE